MDSLPVETLHQIFEHFEGVISFQSWEQVKIDEILDQPPPKDLIALSQVNRQFRDVARPLIYRTIAFQWREDKYESIMKNFFRSLFAAPQIGSYVKNLHIDDIRAEFNVDEAVLSKDWAAGLSDRRRRWLKKVGPSDDGMLVVLVLAADLRLLDCRAQNGHIGAYLSGRDDLEEYFSNKWNKEDSEMEDEDEEEDDDDDDDSDAGDTPGPVKGPSAFDEADSLDNNSLPTLKELRFRYDCGDDFESVQIVEGALLHPGIKCLRLSCYTWIWEDVKKMTWHQANNIEEIQLVDCLVDAAGLKNILVRSPKLRRLSLILPPVSRMGDTELAEEINLSQMGSIIREYGKNLEHLQFETVSFRDYFCPDGKLGPLTELESLRHLKVSIKDLGGDYELTPLEDDLPRNLETLSVMPEDDSPPLFGSSHIELREELRELLTNTSLASLDRVEFETDTREGSRKIKKEEIPGWEYLTLDKEIVRNDERSDPQILTIIIYLKHTDEREKNGYTVTR